MQKAYFFLERFNDNHIDVPSYWQSYWRILFEDSGLKLASINLIVLYSLTEPIKQLLNFSDASQMMTSLG